MMTLMGKLPAMLVAAIMLASVGATGAAAQAASCRVPDTLPAAGPDDPFGNDVRRDIPVGSYRLSLSWSPEFCHGHSRRKAALQCGPAAIGRFGFVLHGLWPQGRGAVWPQFCRAVPPVPEKVVRQSLCATPSVDLIEHEWQKHGSCMSPSAASYFAAARTLYDAIRVPDMMSLSRRGATAETIRSAFARINPGLPPSALAVDLSRRGWLEGVGICFNLDFRAMPCPKVDRGARTRGEVKIWRGR